MLRAIFEGKRYLGAFFLVMGLFAGSAGSASAQTVLTLENPARGITVELTMDDLLAMPQTSFATEDEWFDGLNVYSGPLVRDVLAFLGDGFEYAEFIAINDYSAVIPVSDFFNYDAILALSRNGTPLSVRGKGPIWVMYPLSDNPEIQDRIYYDRLVWQLVRIVAL